VNVKKFAIFVLIIVFAAGCAGKQPKKGASGKKTLAPLKPASEFASPVRGKCGSVSGVVELGGFSGRYGNLFLYIIDLTAFPEKTVTLASTFYVQTQLTTDNFAFEMSCVPPGKHRITAVWDTAPPYCEASQHYCPASHKDGIGQSEPIVVERGGAVKNVKISVF